MRNMRAPLVGVVLLSSAGALARRFEGRHAIGYGTNLGNTLEAPKEGDWQGHYATAEFFEDQKGAGFSTVRIPVRWDLHMGETAPYTINATFLARIQEVVGWCLAPGLNCIVNAHWDSWIDTNSSAVFQERLPRYTALWEQVGAAFAGASDSLWFESYNEPENLSTDDLNAMLAAFYSALRPLHPDRLLIYGWLRGMGASWIQENNHSNWNAMAFNESDPNLAVEVHSYDPWFVCGDPQGPWGKPGDLLNMQYLFGNLSLWSQTHNNIPVFIGESGCEKQQPTRLGWYRDFFRFCVEGFNGTSSPDVNGNSGPAPDSFPGQAGCLIWDDEGDFMIENRTAHTFNASIMEAIGLWPQ